MLDCLDKYSYDFYIAHMIFIKGVLSVLDLTNSYILNILLMLIATSVSAYILHSACEGVKKLTLYIADKVD